MTLRGSARAIVSIAVLVPLYVAARASGPAAAAPSAEERAKVVKRYSFEGSDLPLAPTASAKLWTPEMVPLAPGLEHLRGWATSVVAGASFADFDGDGLANDLCVADARQKVAIIQPAPGTGDRYAPIALVPPERGEGFPPEWSLGCLPGDMNEDGLMDVLVLYVGRGPILYLRTAEGYRAQELIPSLRCSLNYAAINADFDGDGHNDLLIGSYTRDGDCSLDVNQKDFGMNDSFSVATNTSPPLLLRWNGATRGETPSVNYAQEHTALPSKLGGWTLAMAMADLDGDLLPEVYAANDFGPDWLLHNRSTPGHIRFELARGKRNLGTVKSKTIGLDAFNSMGVDFADLNGDGKFDMFVSNITVKWGMIQSDFAWINTGETQLLKDGIAPFVDQSTPMGLDLHGWAWDNKIEDLDNDGTPEILQAAGYVKGTGNQWPELQEVGGMNDRVTSNPYFWPRIKLGDDLSGHEINAVYARAANGRYTNVAQEVGAAGPYATRGIATADVDGDGDIDFVLANSWEPFRFYKNDCPSCGAFLGLHVRFPIEAGESFGIEAGHPSKARPGRPAVGAVATVTLPSGRKLIGRVDGGSGHSGRRSPDLHFGLGAIAPQQKLKVDLRWRDPNGKLEERSFESLPGWHTVTLGSTGGDHR